MSDDHENRIASLEDSVFGPSSYWGRDGRSLESRIDDLESAIRELRERLAALQSEEGKQ